MFCRNQLETSDLVRFSAQIDILIGVVTPQGYPAEHR